MEPFEIFNHPIVSEELCKTLSFEDAVQIQSLMKPPLKFPCNIQVIDRRGDVLNFQRIDEETIRIYKRIKNFSIKDIFRTAVDKDDLQTVRTLFELGVDINSFYGIPFESPIDDAIALGNIDMVRLLVGKINPDDSWKDRGLVIASREGHTNIVRMLLEEGANVNATDDEFRNPLLLASTKGFTEIVRMLLEKGASNNYSGNSPLIMAARIGNAEIVQMLLERGYNVNESNDIRNTALIMASATNGVDGPKIVKMLLEKGAIVDKRNEGGETALMFAAERGYTETVKILLEYGANIDLSDDDDDTPLIFAVKNGRLETVKLLLERGADVQKEDEDELTALDWAKRKRNTEMINLLKAFGAK